MQTKRTRTIASVRGMVAAVALLMGLSMFVVPAASAAPVSPGSATGQRVVAAGTADAKARLGKAVRLGAAKVNVSGSWAFLSATMQSATGGPFSYAGTPFADAAAHGGKSKMYVGLFRSQGPRWVRVDSAVGPTDVAWAGWDSKYGAPSSIFRV